MALSLRRSAAFAAAVVAIGGLTPLLGTPAFATGLAKPTGLAPNVSSADASAEPQKDPVLSWSPVAGAAGYHVELSHSDDWTDDTTRVTLPDDGQTAAPLLALPQTLQHGDYFWRVRALTASSKSPWSDDAELYRGWDDQPTLGDANPSTWRFAWTALPDASSYQIEFSGTPSFDTGSADQGNYNAQTASCLTTHTVFTPYVSIQGADAGVDKCEFGVDTFPAGSPVYWRVRGIDDSDSAAPDGASAETLECFGLSSSSDVSSDAQLTTAKALGTPTSTGQECSRWSATGTVDLPTAPVVSGAMPAAPASVTVTCPAATFGEYTCTDTPEIDWTPTVDAASYRVTIADDAQFSSIQRIYETSFTALSPRDQLPDYRAGKGYHVAVQACTAPDARDDSCGAPTTVTFTKATKAVDGLTATHGDGSEVLSWNDLSSRYAGAFSTAAAPVVEAKNYRVQLASAADDEFANPLVSVFVDRACSSATMTCYQPPSSDVAGRAEYVLSGVADGSYLWRVTPIDESGNHLHSAVGTLVLDTTAPTVRLTDGSGVPVNGNLHVASTEPLAGVTGTSLAVKSARTGDVVAGTLTKTSATRWTFDPKGRLVTGESYVLAVTGAVTDGAGNGAVVGGKPARTSKVADDKGPALHLSSAWHRHHSSQARGGTYSTTGSGHSAAVRVAGSTVRVYGCKSPDFGRLSIAVDGKVVKSAREHQSFTECGVLLWKGAIDAGTEHTVRLTASGGASVDQVRVR